MSLQNVYIGKLRKHLKSYNFNFQKLTCFLHTYNQKYTVVTHYNEVQFFFQFVKLLKTGL